MRSCQHASSADLLLLNMCYSAATFDPELNATDHAKKLLADSDDDASLATSLLLGAHMVTKCHSPSCCVQHCGTACIFTRYVTTAIHTHVQQHLATVFACSTLRLTRSTYDAGYVGGHTRGSAAGHPADNQAGQKVAYRAVQVSLETHCLKLVCLGMGISEDISCVNHGSYVYGMM